MSEEEKAEETQAAQEEGVEQGQPLTPREMLEKEAPEETSEETQEESEETPAEETEETPAETEEEAAEETEETETLEPLEEEESETPESIPYGAFKERIGKKNEQIEAERRRAQELEEENQRLKATPPQSAPVGYKPEAAPKRDDFEDEDAYLDARAAWSGREAFREEQAKSDAAAAQKAEEDRVAEVRQKAQETARDYLTRTETILTKARAENPEKYSDFDAREEVVRSAGLSHEAVQSLVTAEDPVKIVNYLGGKTEELQRIAKLSPLEQVEEIGYLKRRASVKPKERKIPKAPPPPKTPTGGGDTQKRKVTDEMSDSEFDRLAAHATEKGLSARSMLE